MWFFVKIEGDHSKITLNTKNVFIECTATDLHKAEIVLNTVVTMFSEYCANKFEVEPVQVTQYNGQTTVYPILDNRLEIIDANEVNRKIGTNIDEQRMVNLLSRMGLSSRALPERKIEVTIPVTRSDILHACDIIEDIAIGYGFNNIQKTIPKTDCFSNEVFLLPSIHAFIFKL